MEGTDKQCCVARLVVYFVTVRILGFGLNVSWSAVMCLLKEQTDSALWNSYSDSLCDSLYIGIGC